MSDGMNDEPTDADLTRLADRSLPDAQAEALRHRVRESSVHAAVRERTAGRSTRAPRTSVRSGWRPRVIAPLAVGALAAVVLVIVLLSAGPRSLTVARTARLALAAPTRSAPAVDPADSDLLSLRVDSIPFPAYERHTDWRATGARTDRIDARRVQTVFYDIAGQTVGYSIVAGTALRIPHGQRRTIDGVRYVTATAGGAELVTWQRDGHTCVIAGRRASQRTLLRLATARITI
jgi:hypothetical protein